MKSIIKTIRTLVNALSDWVTDSPIGTTERDKYIAKLEELSTQMRVTQNRINRLCRIKSDWEMGVGFGLTNADEKQLADLKFHIQVLELRRQQLMAERDPNYRAPKG